MGLLDSVKGFLGMDDDLYDDDFDDVEDDYVEDEADYEEKPKPARHNPFSINRESSNVYEDKKKSISVIQATKFEDAPRIADIIKDGYPVIFDVSGVEYDAEAEKVVDFMSGTVYGLGGDIKRISGGIFIAVPRNMGISSEQIRNNIANGKFNF